MLVQSSYYPLTPVQLYRRPLFTGGGDRDRLSLYLRLFAGSGLGDLLRGALESTESVLPRVARRPAGGAGLGDLEYESLLLLGGDELSRLAPLRGDGDRESYEGDRLSTVLFRGALLTEETLLGLLSRES